MSLRRALGNCGAITLSFALSASPREGPVKTFGQLNFLTEDLTVGGTVGLRYIPEAKAS